MSPAGRPPTAAAPATSGKCAAVTKRGGRCPGRAEGPDGLCLLHDPRRTAERAALLSQRGRSGQAKRAAAARDRRRDVVAAARLGTTAEIRSVLERAAGLVEASGGDAAVRANALARLCGVALDLLRVVDLEREVEALRELVTQRLPELRGRLDA